MDTVSEGADKQFAAGKAMAERGFQVCQNCVHLNLDLSCLGFAAFGDDTTALNPSRASAGGSLLFRRDWSC